MVPRPFTLLCGPAVFLRTTRRQCKHTAIDRFTQANVIPRPECVRHHRLRIGGLTFPRVAVQSRVQVHTRWQLSRKAIVSRHSRITEIQMSQTCGTSETTESSSATEIIPEMQTISAMQTIHAMRTTSEMETIIFVVTGINTFLRGMRGIGIAIGTATLITGGMATGAASLTEVG